MNEQITLVDNIEDDRLTPFRNLRGQPSRKDADSDWFVVEGRFLVRRLLASRHKIQSVVIEQGRDIEQIGAPPRDVPIYELPNQCIRRLAGFDFHRGYLACAKRPDIGSIGDYRLESLSLALVAVSDLENVGSLIRTAGAFGIEQILIDQHSADPYSRRVTRVSMGAALGMRFIWLDDPGRDLAELSCAGSLTLATSIDSSAVPLARFQSRDQPIVLILGSEANGLPNEIQQTADHRVIIPMNPSPAGGNLIDSLNVAVAGAIAIYELTKERTH